MKKEIKILNRFTTEIIVVGKYTSIKEACENNRADLYEANLYGADLTGANLYGANLTRADLTRADLTGANLTRADLTGADLTRANLTGANLTGANLTGANLTRANLYEANLTRADLTRANLTGANLTGANLTRANLYEADLTRADLTGANLYGANLTRADLTGADLTEANLYGAKSINYCLITPLAFLKYQTGKIRSFKIVNQESEGICQGGIIYEIGKTYKVDNANADINIQCGAGINLATLSWCMQVWQKGYKILIAEHTTKDIACIPMATDGKYRVHKCKIVGEVDLKEIGLIKADKP